MEYRRSTVKSWEVDKLDLKPRLPEILSTSAEARALVLDLAVGEILRDHEVHERAWIIVVDGEIEVSTNAGGRTRGGPGLMVELAPRERHEVAALAQARLLLLLAPWPGQGHPGGMTLTQKLYTRRHAAKRRQEARSDAP